MAATLGLARAEAIAFCDVMTQLRHYVLLEESHAPGRRMGIMTTYPVSTTPSGVIVMRPEGRLNMPAAPKLRQQLHDLINDGNTRLVVDLAAVQSIDSAVLGALISGLTAAKKAGGDLRIVAPSQQVATVLELTRLTRVLPAYPSVDAAFSDG